MFYVVWYIIINYCIFLGLAVSFLILTYFSSFHAWLPIKIVLCSNIQQIKFMLKYFSYQPKLSIFFSFLLHSRVLEEKKSCWMLCSFLHPKKGREATQFLHCATLALGGIKKNFCRWNTLFAHHLSSLILHQLTTHNVCYIKIHKDYQIFQ